MQGNQNLFVRKDEIEYAWQWCDQLIDGWKQLGDSPNPTRPAPGAGRIH